MDKNKEFAEQLAAARPVSRHLVNSILLDQWPNNAAAADFGIDSQRHYEALYYPIRNREILPAVLDEALDDGQKLTALTRAAPSNPHKDVEFYTARDAVLGQERLEAMKNAYEVIIVETPDMAPQEHGYLTLAGLAQEIRQDEAARKAEDRSSYEKMLKEKAAIVPGRVEEPDQGLEK